MLSADFGACVLSLGDAADGAAPGAGAAGSFFIATSAVVVAVGALTVARAPSADGVGTAPWLTSDSNSVSLAASTFLLS